jgi:hypothetical protein
MEFSCRERFSLLLPMVASIFISHCFRGGEEQRQFNVLLKLATAYLE